MTDELIRKTFAGCLVLEKIGQGGMGIVYKAHHIKLNKVVCIKILPKELETDPRNIEFFLREAEISKQLDHPNTVHVYDYGKEKDRYYIVMSYVEGKSLDTIVKEKGYLSVEEASDIMIGVLKGLEHAHSKNIIHRDIKPSNIIITKEGIPRIIDFGLARRIVEEKQLTITGEMIGTAYFMSPEQGLGNKVDSRSDLYALGATYFYMLTGKYPFEGKSAIEVINQHVNSPIPNLYMLKPELPIWTVRMIEKLMKKKPDERYQTATEVIKELEYYKENGYKNIVISTQNREIIIDGIKDDNEDKEKKDQKVIIQKDTKEESVIEQPKKTQIAEENQDTSPQSNTNKFQDEKSYIISLVIAHSFSIFLTLVLFTIYGYLFNINKFFSFALLMASIFIIFKTIKKSHKLITIYLIPYLMFFAGIYNFAKTSSDNISFFQYFSSFIKTFYLGKSSLFVISIFIIITIHTLYYDIKDSLYKRVIFSLFFFISCLATYFATLNILLIETLPNHKIIILILISAFSIILTRYNKNIYLISYLLITIFLSNIVKIPYINDQTNIIYEKEFKNYQLKVKEIETKTKEDIYLKMSEGNVEWQDVEDQINQEIKNRLSNLEIPEKAKIKYTLIKQYSAMFLNKLFFLFKNTLFLIAVLMMILINIIYAFRTYTTVKKNEI